MILVKERSHRAYVIGCAKEQAFIHYHKINLWIGYLSHPSLIFILIQFSARKDLPIFLLYATLTLTEFAPPFARGGKFLLNPFIPRICITLLSNGTWSA